MTDPADALMKEIGCYGVAGRPLRDVVALLTEAPCTLAELIAATAVPRRTVERVLDLIGPDLAADAEPFRIREDKIALYRGRIGYAQLRASSIPDPLAGQLAGRAGLVRDVARWIEAAPEPARGLDHVPATPETVVRRGLWLAATFDLAGANVLFLGDHDLTSLAVLAISPDASVAVADIDERVLAHIGTLAHDQRLQARCRYADLRFGLPAELDGWADLVFTDPPYTPEGAGLFLARGLQSLRHREHGRIVLAYGYSDRHPSLGRQVQDSMQRLGVAFEAILPRFNRYTGAQAVGSASDLYVCRPTSRTWKVLPAAHEALVTGIYTHGQQAAEAVPAALRPAAAAALAAAAAGDDEMPVAVWVTSGAPPPGWAGAKVLLETLFARGLPGRLAAGAAVADLAADPGPWLLRALLAANVRRLAIAVAPHHPDIATRRAQRELQQLVRHKFTLSFLPPAPGTEHAIVVATEDAAGDGAARLTRYVLSRAHGKIGNTWREGLIRVAGELGLDPVTKNQARALIAAAAPPDCLDTSLMSLPRQQIADLLEILAVW
ncbi:MAG TPA: bis-aminopropyl spermidine synthase family protein [Streptosporangiaceae bacterium]